jgi:hypothetical protein
VLSTPPAFVLSQDQTLQTKTKKAVQNNLTKPETSGKKTTAPLNGKKRHGQKQQTKTTKHTIEFSNNTPVHPRNNSAAKSRFVVVRTVRNPPK